MKFLIKKIFKKINPSSILNRYRNKNLKKKFSIINKLSIHRKFDYIYKNEIWGKKYGNKFYSGHGSHNQKTILPYINIIKQFLSTIKEPMVVDLGCGDFNIGSQIFPLTKKYYGIDIVEDLINFNKTKFNHSNLDFIKLNISNDDLPKGDICLVRLVLQHLSNKEISLFINNIINKYKFLIITEILPIGKFRANFDIETNFGTRLTYNSGVVLHQPPFNLKFNSMKILLSTENLLDLSAELDEGKIQTLLYNL